jgi:hypothetical protein
MHKDKLEPYLHQFEANMKINLGDKMKRSKIALFTVSTALAIGAAFTAFTVTAAPPTMIETTYFSDASMSTQVGYRVRTCSGRTITSGTVTAFKEVTAEPCWL